MSIDPANWTPLFLKWLNPRRMRAQAIVLAFCLWGVCAVDFATPGLFDWKGNIKFQDFLPFYVSARLIAQHRSAELYDETIQAQELENIVGQPTQVRLSSVYGPQVGLFFVPLARFSFLMAACIWAILGVLIYFVCVYAAWRCCPGLRPFPEMVLIAALAFPPLFHCFVRGQISPLPLACFTAALLALHTEHDWLAGIALGFLILKPTFLVAIPLILFFAGAWKIFGGLSVSAAAQMVFARFYFGSGVTHAYLDLFQHPSRWMNVAELSLAPIQMHSLRSFWSLLIPSPTVALALYILSSLVVIGGTVAIWKSSLPLALRFSALTFAAVLVSPHLFIYDLLVLAPALLLLVDRSLSNVEYTLRSLLQMLAYLAFVLPLLGPLSRWTHLQLSVVSFSTLLCVLFRFRTSNLRLASAESGVV